MKHVTLPLCLSVLLSLSLSGCIVVKSTTHGGARTTKTLQLDSEDLRGLTVNSGAGDIRIQADDSSNEIRVQAEIYAQGPDSYQLTLEQYGDNAELIADSRTNNAFYVGDSPRIHLDITMPSHMMLSIDDGSGDIEVYGVRNHVSIDDGSGEIRIDSVTGDLDIDDGSGDMIITNITGNAKIEDGSGSIQLTRISGNIDVDDDSGDFDAQDIGGDLNIVDGSGSIDIYKVGGHVTVDDGSGDLSINEARGLTIIDAGSGDLNIKNVNGELTIN